MVNMSDVKQEMENIEMGTARLVFPFGNSHQKKKVAVTRGSHQKKPRHRVGGGGWSENP
jgi:hypothetical protein